MKSQTNSQSSREQIKAIIRLLATNQWFTDILSDTHDNILEDTAIELEALLKQSNLEVLDRLEKELPPAVYVGGVFKQNGLNPMQIDGPKEAYNQALTEVKTIIKRARRSYESTNNQH